MNFKNISSALIVLLSFSVISNAQIVDSLYEIAAWQGFRSGAVTFTFDDNTPNQISVALPIFDKYGYKMTFYPVVNWGPNWTAFKAAALNGHEVGSHTVTHADLSSLTDEQQVTEFKNSQDVINSNIKGQMCLTIAYPFCVLGNASICNQYYVAARGCSGVIVPKTPPDFMNISSIVCGTQGSIQRSTDFTNKADAAASSNGWVVFLIHAIDNESGYSPTSSAELDKVLEHFSQNDNKYWVSTFGNVARYIKERDNISILQTSDEDSVITFSITDTLDNSIYNYPVTIRRVLPEGWTFARISQNNKTINSEIVTVDEESYIMFDIVPDSGEVKLIKEKATNLLESFNSQISNPFLMQNYPNPFNPVTNISYQIAEASFVTLKVYDIVGREVATLVDEKLSPGRYSKKFDAGSANGGLASGLYFYNLIAGNYMDTKKLIFLK